MGFAGGQYIVVRPVLLQDPPHAVDIVPCVSPIALRVEIAAVEMALQPMGAASDDAADRAGDEGLSPRRPRVIESNAVGCVQSEGLTIVHDDPRVVELDSRIGAGGVKQCGLALRRLREPS